MQTEYQKIDLDDYSKPLILIGQHPKDKQLDSALADISNEIPVLRFPLNNLSEGINYSDLFIDQQKELQPDLLITSGLSVLSKRMKIFLRNIKPKKHIHFDPAGVFVDTFQSDPDIKKTSLISFLKHWKTETIDTSYRENWTLFEEKTKQALNEFADVEQVFSETMAAKEILKSVPAKANLHLSNSMPVRYADMFGVSGQIECFSNRGTSGIDGCTSTAFGAALVSDKKHVLITGDLAFLYDRNAFFNNYKPSNLRIIVLNNQGGGIFRLIDGPSELPELEAYFETRHNRTAEYICAENEMEYLKANTLSQLKNHFAGFYEPSDKIKVLEVFTNPEINQKVYRELKKQINERIKN